MKAIVITRAGAPEVLRLRDVPDPDPGPDDVLVRVAATSVNRADLLQRQGRYPAPDGWPADIPGLEFAGTVEAVGENARATGGRAVGPRGGPDVGPEGGSRGRPAARPAVGDRVMGLVGGGGYAEYVALPADQLIPVPDALPLTDAAAVPEVFITAHDALRARAGLRAGETLLIHAVGSGVGTAALQMARAWGCRVLGTSRTGWKLDRARELGLDTAIDASDGDWSAAVRDATDGDGVDVILDLVGGAYLAGNLRSLKTLGRQVVVGLPAGRTAEIDLGALLSKRLTLVGTALRSRSRAEKAQATASFAEDVAPLLADGSIRPIIHATLPMAEAARAHELVASNETYGSVVLRW